MTSKQYYALQEMIENLLDIATLKPINSMDLVAQNARNIRAIAEDLRPTAIPVCACGSKKVPEIVAPVQYLRCRDCGGKVGL